MFSESPGIPAFRQQMPRTTRRIFTPAQDASYSAAMISLSQREFIFAMIDAGFPSFACFISRLIRCRNFVLSHSGATESMFQFNGSEYPESMLKTAVASSPIIGLQVMIPQSV